MLSRKFGIWDIRKVNRQRIRPRCEVLENRWVPTTNLILDFDGGTLQSNSGYNVDPSWTGVNFTAFNGFAAQGPTGTLNRSEQIQQIIAGVRMDYADMDVNVIWDDRGVNSPLFTGISSVIMVVNDPPAVINEFFIFGIAASLDPTTKDVGLVFEPEHYFQFPDTAYQSMREIIDTCSHEAGHTFGLEHTSESDAEFRQLCTVAFQNQNLDSRFSFEVLDHFGSFYAERDRLFQTVGKQLTGKNLGTGERMSNNTLPQDTPIIAVDAQSIGLFSGNISFSGTSVPLTIEYGGDRDAFRVNLTAGNSYAIRERANGSGIDPILSIFDSEGDYLVTGTQGILGGVSTALFTPTKSGTYYIVAGTGFDRTGSAVVGTPTLGNYNLEITPSWLEINTVAKTVTVSGTNGPDFMSAIKVGVQTRVTLNGASVQVANANSKTVNFSGGAGNDTYSIDWGNGVFLAAINDSAGADDVTVLGTPVADQFTITTKLVTTSTGGKLNINGTDSLAVFGLAGNDLFGVTSGNTPITVHGGDPVAPASPGDALGITTPNGTQFPANPSDGQFTFPTSAPIIYTGIESFGADVPAPPPPPRTSFAVGSGALSLPQATLYSNGRDTPTYTIMAYDPSFRGGVRVATGDVNGDGIVDLIAAAGPTGGPHIQVFNGAIAQPLLGPVTSFMAYDPRFTGGVWVAAGDVNGDGKADIITGADTGGGPHVKVFDAATGNVLFSFFAYSPSFTGGVRVAAGDVTGDGKADIITAAGPGGGPHVRVFSGADGKAVREFFAYNPSFTGGVFVSASDVNGDGMAEIATGTGQGGGPLVTLRDGATNGLLHQFFAFSPGSPSSGTTTGQALWSSGVRVALADTDGDGIAEIFAAPGQGRTSILKAFLSSTGAEIWSKSATDPTYLGGVILGN